MSNDAFEYKNKGLKAIIDTLNEKMPKAKVGIIGAKNGRVPSEKRVSKTKVNLPMGNSSVGSNDTVTNSIIGAKHEFGDHTVPQRSFLRTPIIENFQKYLEKAGAFNQKSFEKVIKEKSFLTYVKKLGIIGETIVLDAFATGGFGKWEPSNMDHKKNKQTLVETQQLRNSITSRVDEND